MVEENWEWEKLCIVYTYVLRGFYFFSQFKWLFKSTNHLVDNVSSIHFPVRAAISNDHLVSNSLPKPRAIRIEITGN